MKHVVFFIALALIAVFVFFWLGVIHTLWQALVAWLVVTVIAFLFTTVAANAIAIVGSNPVSGMTLMTLIVASAIFVSIGLSGTSVTGSAQRPKSRRHGNSSALSFRQRPLAV